jgi:hypothetical protein
MIPPEFENFFFASAGVSATLIGLLFVAVSVRPERVFGSEAAGEHFSTATGAFTAFINALFISLGALVPYASLGVLALVMGALLATEHAGAGPQAEDRVAQGTSWKSRSGTGVDRLHHLRAGVRYGWALLRAPEDMQYVSNLAILLLAVYGVGLGRAWELLGARRWRLLAWFFSLEEDDADAGSSGPDQKPEDRAP